MSTRLQLVHTSTLHLAQLLVTKTIGSETMGNSQLDPLNTDYKQLLLELSCILGEHSTSFQYQKSCLDLASCQRKATANKNTETAMHSSQATTNKNTDMTKLSTSGHYKYKHCGCLLWQHKHKHKHGDAVNLRLLQTQTLRQRAMLSSQLDLDSAVAAACVQASCQHGHNLLSAGKLNETSQEL